jgi:PhzF family phenazine biosynthesis protein
MKFCAVDAFADDLFKGNPAAVCVVDKFPSEEFMFNVAGEFNLSETAFVVPVDETHFLIRWFTPKVEVSLCGHATLAAAHVLWNEQKSVVANEIFFNCKSGELRVWRDESGINLDFPVSDVSPIELPVELRTVLGVEPLSCSQAGEDWLVELDSEATVKALTVDMAGIEALPCRSVIVTAPGSITSGFDFVSRFYGPKGGVPEDPVTGSAHCKLAPFWANKLQKLVFNAYQASSRGGVLKVQLVGDRVYLTGNAVTAFSGILRANY